MAIAEAQAHAVPVVTTQGAPWQGLVDKGRGWWVEQTKDDIVTAMDEAMRMEPASLKEMGCSGRRWMEADYDWASVSAQMASVYDWLCQGGEVPACVYQG